MFLHFSWETRLECQMFSWRKDSTQESRRIFVEEACNARDQDYIGANIESGWEGTGCH